MRFITQDYYTKAAVILRILWVFGRQWHIGWDEDWARPAARWWWGQTQPSWGWASHQIVVIVSRKSASHLPSKYGVVVY